MADLKEIGKQAKAARYILAGLDTDTKNKALFTAAECLEADAADILAENAKDLEAGRSRSMPEGLLDRLSLTQKRISDMAEGLRQVAALDLQHTIFCLLQALLQKAGDQIGTSHRYLPPFLFL